jgi:hypothetical protein
MKTLALSLLSIAVGLFARASAQAQDVPQLRERAERHFADGSYALARDVYERLDALELEASEARWIDFRLADTTWRAAAGSNNPDDTELERARQSLERLVRDVERKEDRDRVWLEVQVSLGDFWWIRSGGRNWSAAWPYYQRAFETWSASSDVDAARARYLELVWRITEAHDSNRNGFHSWMPDLPLGIVDGALQVAQDPSDIARAHYLVARTLNRQGWDVRGRKRLLAELEAAIETGAEHAWYDDALFAYAQQLANQGRVEVGPDGSVRYVPDYVAAAALYRRLTKEFAKGDTRYFDQAKQEILNITGPRVGLGVSNAFLPGSKIQVHLSWRNVARVDLSLIAVDLTADVRLSGRDQSQGEWLASIELAGKPRLRSWSEAVEDEGDHVPGSRALLLEGSLEPGAYVIEALAGGERARELVLVSDLSLLIQAVDRHAVLWATRALDGRPVAEARVHLWSRRHDGRRWVWREYDALTDEQGLARFELKASESSRQFFAAARSASSQAFTQGHGNGDLRPEAGWRIYTTTDRPAYRPEDRVHWKLVARRGLDGAYTVPAGETVEYQVSDPMGAEVASGSAKLNAFGSAHGTIELEVAWTLGEYRVTYWNQGKHSHIGSATLFRLEEYKLPEFLVTVRTPEQDGRKQTFRSGDTVEVEVRAEYYFGGPVTGAAAEVLVYRDPYWPRWQRVREYPWFFEAPDQGRRYGSSQLVSQQVLETDALGQLKVSFESEADAGTDFEYRVVARVTDASRREVSGSGSVRVTHQRYYVQATPRHNLHRPQDTVTVDFELQDANGEPFAAEGSASVRRMRTVQVWVDARGERAPVRPATDPEGWRLESQTTEYDDILTRVVKTDTEGRVELAFTPERTGAYTVAWNGRDDDGTPITAATTVYVADDASGELGVRHGALQIVLDRDTCRAGQTAAVMLMAPSSDRWVLFTQHAGDLYDVRVVHLTGSVKLLSLAVDARHVPNVFFGAQMISDGALWSDVAEVIVPPVEQFLTVELSADEPLARPGSAGTLTVTTRDHTGEPVAAEVSLALVDAALLAIQSDYAGDPRPFFHGRKRRHRLSQQSSFQYRSYARLREDAKGVLFDQRQAGAGGGYRGPGDTLGGDQDFVFERGSANAPTSIGLSAPMEVRAGKMQADASEEAPGQGASAVTVRSDFRTTALWEPAVLTGADGSARVPVRYPDSVTQWMASARAADATSRFGMAETSTRTRLPLQVRLQAPRFFVAGDRCTVSALIDNNSDQALVVHPELALELIALAGGPEDRAVRIEPGQQARVDWSVTAPEAGIAKLTARVRAGEYADAMERELTVYEHGIDKLLAKSGKLVGEELALSLDLPAARRATTLDVRVAPSLAVTMLDALPYLIDYPYGCTEQTMSRFLPAVITARTLAQLGIAPKDVAGRMFGGIVPEHAAATHPKGARDLKQLDAIVSASIQRLADFQHADGGWGWWKTGDSDPFMSAYVLWGLALAREAGVEAPESLLERGASYLALELVEAEREPDLQAWMLHALATHLALASGPLNEKHALAAADNLWGRRDGLNAYTRALLALATHHLGQRERARTLIDNLRNGVLIDETSDVSGVSRGQTQHDPAAQRSAHWGNDGVVWRWSQGSVEATAFCLRALMAIDPANDLVAPVSLWLVRNRRGAQWNHTRDTAISVLALNDYLKASGELVCDLDYELWVNDERIAQRTLEPADVISAPGLFSIPAESIRDGENQIRLVRTRGEGPLYLSCEARFFSLEEPVTPAGNEVFARRQYNRLAAVPTLLAGTRIEKRPWAEGDRVPSGERIEVVLTIEAKNDLEYLIFEDLKPAGLEAANLKSGEPISVRELKSGALDGSLAAGGRHNEDADYTGRARSVHQELRDRKVALFIDKLPQGLWELRYELRAEVPGTFHALPLMGQAMYVPEIRCNGLEVRFEVFDE